MPDVFGEGPSSAEIADEQRRKALRDRIRPLSEMLRVESDDAEMLLGPLVRRGQVTLIGAYGGDGKSTLCMDISKTLATGGDMLGWSAHEKYRVLYIDLEQGVSEAQRKVMMTFYPEDYIPSESVPDIVAEMELGADIDNIRYADWREGVTFSGPGPDMDALREEMEAHPPDVVIVDPVYKLLMGSDSNENVVVGALIAQLDLLREDFGCAIVLPMHPRKAPSGGGGGVTMHDLYGSGMWGWWASVILTMKRGGEGDLTTLSFEKDRTGVLPRGKWTLTFDPKRGFRRAAGEADESDGPTLPAHLRIWALLQQVAPDMVTRKDIKAMLEMPQRTVERNTQRLVTEHEKKGLWPGLVVQAGPSNKALYGFSSAEVGVVNAIKDEFGASEAAP